MYRKNIIVNTLLLAFSLLLVSCKSEPHSVSQQESASGMPYTLVKMPGNDRVSIHVAWPSAWSSGDKNQAVPEVGTQLLLAGGAEGYKIEDVSESMQDMDSNAFITTEPNYVLGTIHYSPKHQAETMKLANAHLRSPLLDEAWLVRVRDGLSQNVGDFRSVPANQLIEALRWSLFGDHPVRESLSLDVEGVIDAVSREEVEDWVQSTFTRNGVTVVISGDIDTETASAAIDALFDGLSDGTTPTLKAAPVSFNAKRILLHTPDAETATINILGKMPPKKDAVVFEDVLLATELGGKTDESILFKVVRDELNASYSFGAAVVPLTLDNQALVFSGQVEESKVNEVEAAIVKAYAEFKKAGPTANLSELKSIFKDELAEGLTDTGSTGMTALAALLSGGDPADAINLAAELDAVTDASRQERLSNSFPSADELIIVVSSPNRDALDGACVIEKPEEAADCE